MEPSIPASPRPLISALLMVPSNGRLRETRGLYGCTCLFRLRPIAHVFRAGLEFEPLIA
jgi:hypothetical protein